MDSQLPDGHWTPETVLSSLPQKPQENTTSPIPFFHILERLKTTKREGWRRFGINHGETISDHMYRMSIITMFCPPTLAAKLDIARCTRMALIHDMAESLVGDITPKDGVSKPEKSRREAETMDYLCDGLLGKVYGGANAQSMKDVWREYEDDLTPEAHFVHDVDKIELLLQMVEYERSNEGRLDLGEFSRVASRVVLPEVQEWAAQIIQERTTFWSTMNKTASGEAHISDKLKQAQDEYYGGQPKP
ncbi:hypothetical protein AMS68_005813 [Peltaster fructicola]|uniref:5'-deoxynucleotidase n=1 Tax=Peltaster fructicola TaxID=286661 RepID=A0A6H0Y032_9PEZI|nr:hypothetical protein AMS68_005813 [Peltaster fructicola]